MKSIIVVECISSSINYINDIRLEGYEPIALELYVDEEHREEKRRIHDLYFDVNGVERPRVVMAACSYEETLEMVRNLEPVVIVPGGDDGIDLATRLSEDLGLPGNRVSSLPAMRDKHVMQEALHQAGLRYIRSCIVSTVEEAIIFYHTSCPNHEIVVKPVTGGATVGVHICSSEAELVKALNENMHIFRNADGMKGQMMVQEYIGGTEFSVDTISCHGKHKVLFTTKYYKTIIPGYGPIYNYCFFSSTIDDETRPICDYALKVLDAVGITNGVVHAEYKVDEYGPVLIETNCRPYGLMLRAAYVDSFLGHHETNQVLKVLLHPEEFLSTLHKPNEQVGYGIVSFVNLKKDTFIRNIKTEEVFGHLDSFFYESHIGDNRIFHRTIDLSTTFSFIYLSNKNLSQLQADNHFIQEMSEEHIEQLFDH